MQYRAFFTATDESGEGTKNIANGVGNLPSDMSTPEAIGGYKKMGEGVKSVGKKTVIVGVGGIVGGGVVVAGVGYTILKPEGVLSFIAGYTLPPSVPVNSPMALGTIYSAKEDEINGKVKEIQKIILKKFKE